MRRMTMLLLGVAVLLGAACSSDETGPSTEAQSSTSPAATVAPPPSPDASSPDGSPSSVSPRGEFSVRVVECTTTPVDSEDVLSLIAAKLDEAYAEGPSAIVEPIGGDCFATTTYYVTRVAAEAAAAAIPRESHNWGIYLRPVVGGCQVLPDTGSFDESDLGPTDPNSTQYRLLLGDPAQVCVLGPQQGTGEVFDNAIAEIINGAWGVMVELTAHGEDIWNNLAEQCFDRVATCPTGQLAIELDGVIQTAPTVNVREFEGSLQISGEFTESEARVLARAINVGSLPVELVVESVTVTG